MEEKAGRKLKICFLLGILLFGIGIFTACEEEGAEYVDELDVVVTRYDTEFDFSTVKTYVMPDTVIRIPGERTLTASDSALDAAIKQRVAENFENLGYVRLEDNGDGSEEPDVVATLTLIERNVYAVSPYPNPWYGYWAWYNWGYWGFSYIGHGWHPHYPHYWGVYSYLTGTLVVDMMQPEEGEENNQIPVLWNGLFNGIYTYGLGNRMLEGIDQMFEQSPYLSQN